MRDSGRVLYVKRRITDMGVEKQVDLRDASDAAEVERRIANLLQ